MAVLCSEIWLLIGVVFVIQMPVIRSQICQQGWTLHGWTRSCMALIRDNYKYNDARSHCKAYSSSSTTKGEGHLVFIFDKATDDFVKGLLNEGHVDRAFIGLNDRENIGDYAWGDNSPIPAIYTGWAVNPHIHDYDYGHVVMTKAGWRKYYWNSPAGFVCQVNVDFPTPRMVCPVAGVGQESPDITCTIDTHPSLTITSLRFMQTAAVVASCDGRSCWPSQGYPHVVDVRKSQETTSSASWTLKLNNVRIRDENDWSCSVEFNNESLWVGSHPCSWNVYTKPADIQCSHMFVQRMARTTCTAAKVYPEAGCTWQVKYGTRKLHVYNQTSSNEVVSGEGYYRATCNAAFSISNAGTYVVAVVMKPNFGIDAVKETSVSVAPPQQPPQLYLSGQRLESSWVEVVENQTLNITCRVPGGDPEVYRTIIKCSNTQQPFESDGSSVTMDVGVTRAFHGQKCTCDALHAASYTQTSSVDISVTYPATVTQFQIGYRGRNAYTYKGYEFRLICSASGNPSFQLILRRQNGPILTNSSTEHIFYTKTAICSDMGIYVCLASNFVQGQPHEDRKFVHLEITCTPEHCSGMSSARFPAAVGAPSVSIKICVRSYPAPTSISLYKGNTTDHRLRADKFQAYFNFTNEEDGLGEITVMISTFAQEDLGDYLLYSVFGSGVLRPNLTFSLFAQAPPQQPPQLYLAGQRLESLWVEVEENQALNITCRVPGGDPEVYRTIIKCNNTQQQFESDGSSVTMDVRVTRAFHGQNCTCSALPAANYTQTSSVEIRVTLTSDSKNDGSQAHYVGAIVGGIVAATLVFVIFCVTIFLWKKKGAPCTRKKDQHANTTMNAVGTSDESGACQELDELPQAQAPENPE